MIGTIAEPWFCKVLKRRAPGLVESNHFAVDHRLIGERRERLRNCRISGVEILVVPRSKMHLAVRLDASALKPANFSSYAQLAPSGNARGGKRSIGSVNAALIFFAGTMVVYDLAIENGIHFRYAASNAVQNFPNYS
jgi:hypothetical protein